MASIIRVGVIADTHIPRKAPRIPEADAPAATAMCRLKGERKPSSSAR